MAMKSSNKGQIFNEINITPLTDIFLVLLIIMMVIAPMFQSVDKNIKMPQINNGTSVEEKPVTVAITKEAQFFLNGKIINPNELENKLSSLVKSAKDKNLVVQADTDTKNKEIIEYFIAAFNIQVSVNYSNFIDFICRIGAKVPAVYPILYSIKNNYVPLSFK